MKLFSMLMAITAMVAIVFAISCSEDEPEPSDPPTITITATGLADGQISADIGEDVVLTISTTAAGGFASLTITEYQGTTEVGSETFTTEQTSYTHTVTEDDVEAPFRINFLITDDEDQTASEDVIITGLITNIWRLQNFSWQFTSQISVNDPLGLIADGAENIQPHQVDDVYSFNTDGTCDLDYGTLAGDFDGLVHPQTYSFSAADTVLTVYRGALQADFTYAPHDTLVWDIYEIDNTEFVGRIIYPLGELLGGAPEDWLWTADETFTAVEKID